MKNNSKNDKFIKKLAREQMEIPEKILKMVIEKTDGSYEKIIINLEMVEIGLRMLISEMKDREEKKAKLLKSKTISRH